MRYYVRVVDTGKFLADSREVEMGAADLHKSADLAQKSKDDFEARTGRTCILLSLAQAEKY